MINSVADKKIKNTNFPKEGQPDRLWEERLYRPYTEYNGPQQPKNNRSGNVDHFELPKSYDATRLTLIPRDPHWIHAYWEIAPQKIQEMREHLGAAFEGATYSLRMHDVTKVASFNGQNANNTFFIDVAPHHKNWSVNLWGDNVAYCGEIGVRTPDGRFHSFVQSNTVSTPRASYSDRSDLVWMDVKDNKSIPFVYSIARRQRIEKALNSAHIPLRFKENGVRKIFLTEDDVRAYYSSLFPMLGRIRRRKKAEKEKTKAARRLRKGREKIDPEKVLFPGMSPTEYYKKFMAGASAEFANKTGASETLSSGASERNQQTGQRKFFFELWTELIVYGRTEPDAHVQHGEKTVALRPDGTFSMRFALPDGNIPLDFVATSKDKIDQRRIATAVERFKTQYTP